MSMRTSFTGALTPNMLAVGKDNPGPIAQTSLYAMLNTWDVRSGRDHKHAVWQDELNDAMASIGLWTPTASLRSHLRCQSVHHCALIRI